MKTNSALGGILIVFIFLIVGAIFLGQVANMMFEGKTLYTVTNESITIASGTGTVANTDIQTVTSFTNLSNAYTIGTDTNFTEGSGTITTNAPDGTFNISYVFYPDLYVKNDSSRSIMSIITVLFAIAVLLGGIGYVVKLIRESGIF